MSNSVSVKFPISDINLLKKISRCRGEDMSSFIRFSVRRELARLSFLSKDEMRALEIQKKKRKLNLLDAYDEVMDAIAMPKFKKWVKKHEEKLAHDYDNYYQQMIELYKEPLGFEIWALGCYLRGG